VDDSFRQPGDDQHAEGDDQDSYQNGSVEQVHGLRIVLAAATDAAQDSCAKGEKKQSQAADDHENGSEDDAESAKRVGGEAVHVDLTPKI
jgi:hypothetical protein